MIFLSQIYPNPINLGIMQQLIGSWNVLRHMSLRNRKAFEKANQLVQSGELGWTQVGSGFALPYANAAGWR
jgi:hypothetical protein